MIIYLQRLNYVEKKDRTQIVSSPLIISLSRSDKNDAGGVPHWNFER